MSVSAQKNIIDYNNKFSINTNFNKISSNKPESNNGIFVKAGFEKNSSKDSASDKTSSNDINSNDISSNKNNVDQDSSNNTNSNQTSSKNKISNKINSNNIVIQGSPNSLDHVYVSTTGNDNNIDDSWPRSLKTIKAALLVVRDGGTIYIANGTYSFIDGTLSAIAITKSVTIMGIILMVW
ncbi:hypothetical protein ALNOE001_20130 [Candidatus Methanobinarius endosymbioticus]|uniref:DUF1565 domain-containing protein n=1 Tax=Candidatus Methanobinarius endosymbioticus TaxID=2006182 RepID=A0A366M8X7_9EURY|nr:hypothetical protein ALNOE001_20130 [Candidatus Methanobinarius endosymbioticus]